MKQGGPSARRSSTSTWLALASVAALVGSLFLQGFPGFSGFELLVYGWFAGVGGHGLAWWANPAVAAALALRYANGVLATLCAGVALGLMLSFLGVRTLMTSTSGDLSPIGAPGAGYWLWLAGGVLAFASCAWSGFVDVDPPV